MWSASPSIRLPSASTGHILLPRLTGKSCLVWLWCCVAYWSPSLSKACNIPGHHASITRTHFTISSRTPFKPSGSGLGLSSVSCVPYTAFSKSFLEGFSSWSSSSSSLSSLSSSGSSSASSLGDPC